MPQHGVTTITQDSPHVTAQSNTTGSMTEFLEVQTPAGKRFTYPAGHPIELFVMTHESFTSSGTVQETFNLGNALADSPSLAGDGGSDGEDTSPPGSGQADAVVYESGSQFTPDNVRYDDHASNPNQIDVTPSASGNTFDVYYVWKDSGLIEGRWYKANEEAYEQVFGTTPGELHTTKTFSRDEQLTFSRGFDAGPKDKVKFFINTSVDLTNWDAFDGGGPNSTTSFSTFRIPVIPRDESRRGVPGRR